MNEREPRMVPEPEKQPEQPVEKREKPEFVYHGSKKGNITELEPRRHYVPGAYKDQDVPLAVYAGDDAAYAAAFGFDWTSDLGVSLKYENEKVVLAVPEKLAHSLKEKVYIYKLPSDSFELLPDVWPEGHNFWSKEGVKPIEPPMVFNSVKEAVEHFGGEVRIIPENTTL